MPIGWRRLNPCVYDDNNQDDDADKNKFPTQVDVKVSSFIYYYLLIII